jgi:hypothetical protein
MAGRERVSFQVFLFWYFCPMGVEVVYMWDVAGMHCTIASQSDLLMLLFSRISTFPYCGGIDRTLVIKCLYSNCLYTQITSW